MTIHRHALTFIVAAMVAMPTGSFAQTERGAISGIVTDQTKAAVPGVSIKVINTGTNVAATVMVTGNCCLRAWLSRRRAWRRCGRGAGQLMKGEFWGNELGLGQSRQGSEDRTDDRKICGSDL